MKQSQCFPNALGVEISVPGFADERNITNVFESKKGEDELRNFRR
jgi:hypothetical protein